MAFAKFKELLRQAQARTVDALSGQAPGSTLTLHAPLAQAQLGVPTKHDFCAQCGISLFDNPDTRILAIPRDPRDDVEVQCDCGRIAHIPKFLFL